jgi:hypothetical protein
MTITNPTVTLPAGRTVGEWLRRHFGWIFTGLGVVAAVVLLSVLLIDRNAASTDVVEPGVSAVPRESITALDHRAEAQARADRESITAIDHRAETAGD